MKGKPYQKNVEFWILKFYILAYFLEGLGVSGCILVVILAILVAILGKPLQKCRILVPKILHFGLLFGRVWGIWVHLGGHLGNLGGHLGQPPSKNVEFWVLEFYILAYFLGGLGVSGCILVVILAILVAILGKPLQKCRILDPKILHFGLLFGRVLGIRVHLGGHLGNLGGHLGQTPPKM